jgi:hypothetical protein
MLQCYKWTVSRCGGLEHSTLAKAMSCLFATNHTGYPPFYSLRVYTERTDMLH